MGGLSPEIWDRAGVGIRTEECWRRKGAGRGCVGGVVGGGSVGAWGGVGTRPGLCPWGGEVGKTRSRVSSTVQLNCSLQLEANSLTRSRLQYFICEADSPRPPRVCRRTWTPQPQVSAAAP